MMDAKHIEPQAGDLLLLVGTTKGAFILRAKQGREGWDIAGPFCQGESVYGMCYDDRGGRRRIFAASRNEHYATERVSSDDFGKSWKQPQVPLIAFPADTGLAVERIWQVAKGHEQDVLYCGVAPSGLFESRDAG